MRATDLEVVLEVEGQPRKLPQDTELAVYRIVQEALTNTVKHAAAGRAEVRLGWRDDALELRILDDGRPPRVGAAGRDGRQLDGARPGEPPGEPPGGSGGHGLIGIRERAAACGGTASAGPAPGGAGYLVTARLPLALRSDEEMTDR